MTTNPEAAPITAEERAKMILFVGEWHRQGHRDCGPVSTESILSLDAFASAETARADEAESERRRHDAHMLEQLGQVAQERDSLRADCAVLENNMNEAMAGEAKAMQERDSLRARLADLTRTCESLAPLATALRDRDAAIRERDKARHDCDHETRIRCDERDRRIAAEKRAEAAEARAGDWNGLCAHRDMWKTKAEAAEARLAEMDRALNAALETADIERRDRRKMRDEKAEAEARCARMAEALRSLHRGECLNGGGNQLPRPACACWRCSNARKIDAALAEGADGANPEAPKLTTATGYECQCARCGAYFASPNKREVVCNPCWENGAKYAAPAHPTRSEEGKEAT